MDASVIDWLMQGDPVIRWQVMRDLTGRPRKEWEAERQRTLSEGWVAQTLACQKPDGGFPTGRWTDTVWTLLVLMDCGAPPKHSGLQRAAERVLSTYFSLDAAAAPVWLVKRMDLCHLGFWLRIASYFMPGDKRLGQLIDTILELQFADGGWNCRLRNYPDTVHSSFHTTFNVLEGLRMAAETGQLNKSRFRESESRALEFMLMHKLYRSDKSGKVIDERFTHLTFPSHWHYNYMRGLDYMRSTAEIADERLADPIALLQSRRRSNGRWPVEKRIPGSTHVEMEAFGSESRWNTLRAMRILAARQRAFPAGADA
jgi:hypothetical protein